MPYSEFVSETEAKGIDVDAVKQAAADECLTPVYKPLTNNSIAMVSQQREADIIVGGWYVTEERAKQVAFTSPLWYDAMGIISKEGYNTIAQLETAGKICSGTGFSFNDTIKKLVGDNYAEYPTQIEIKADLDNGRCQVALDGYAIGVDIYGDSYKVEVAQPDDRVPITTTQPMIALLMSKENPELQTAISEDIDSYRADGQLKNWNAAAGLADSLVIPAAAAATSIR
jgi:polar amino acid transport system substrate-binding protein